VKKPASRAAIAFVTSVADRLVSPAGNAAARRRVLPQFGNSMLAGSFE
jgi:hypothetical protein